MFYVYDFLPENWEEEELVPTKSIFIGPKMGDQSGWLSRVICKATPTHIILAVEGPFETFEEAQKWVEENCTDMWLSSR